MDLLSGMSVEEINELEKQVVAHELNTEINVVAGILEMIDNTPRFKLILEKNPATKDAFENAVKAVGTLYVKTGENNLFYGMNTGG